jgi:hypothetical protein
VSIQKQSDSFDESTPLLLRRRVRTHRQALRRMSDLKAPAAFRGLTVEVLAGSGEKVVGDGDLDKCSFRFPYALCQFDGTLFVADNAIRAVDGVLGSDSVSTKVTGTVSDSEASLTAALLTAIPVLPKELARLMAQYVPPAGVRTVAGSSLSSYADGHALREARFAWPSAMAVDTSDAVAGPQLLTFRSHQSSHSLSEPPHCNGHDHRG